MPVPFLNFEDIRVLQIDPTTRCNLRCPQCARIKDGKVLDNLELTELRIDDYDRIYSQRFSKQVRHSFFNGNYGDPAAARNLIAAVELILRRTDGGVHIVSNGSLQNRDWWSNLASVLKGKGKVTFSIDGLRNTNHIYRVGSNFEKVIQNVEAYIGAGGTAKWDYLVFKHNDHQIEEAKKLAKQLGFSEFNLKYSKRYISEGALKRNSIAKDRVLGLSKNRKEREHVANADRILSDHGSWENYFAEAKISCKFQKKGMIFLDFKGRVWPCTWLAAPIEFPDEYSPQRKSLFQSIKDYADDFNSIRSYSLEEILAHPWFSEALVASWKGERLATCARTCGHRIEYTNGFQKNSLLESLEDGFKNILPASMDPHRNPQ